MSTKVFSVIEALHMKLQFGERVELNYGIIDQIVELLTRNRHSHNYKPFDWKDDQHWPDSSEKETIVSQFFALGNSINFRYWLLEKNGAYQYVEGVKAGLEERGALFMWRALKICLEKKDPPIFDAKRLSRITVSEMSKIFSDDTGNVIMPALEERQKNWNDLGLKLLEFWDGEFYNLVKESHGSLIEFVRLSRQFRAFDDPLCKMAMVNALMHQGRGVASFLEPIFPGIDYQLLKQQLRIGIVVPKRNLVRKLAQRKLLDHNEARELRNAGLFSFLQIMEKTGLPGDIVDNKWWMNRKVCLDLNPQCAECQFASVCAKNTKYGIPFEKTRYY